jgi:hypothetical protein
MPYPHRLLIICPIGAKLAAVVKWFQNNIDPNAVDVNLGPALYTLGDATKTPTFRWCCGCFNDVECKAILVKLCQLAAVAVPTAAQWNNATPTQRRNWWNSVRNNIWTNYGVWCQMADNLGNWDDPVAALNLRGLDVV